jgi:hypothetical protein
MGGLRFFDDDWLSNTRSRKDQELAQEQRERGELQWITSMTI